MQGIGDMLRIYIYALAYIYIYARTKFLNVSAYFVGVSFVFNCCFRLDRWIKGENEKTTILTAVSGKRNRL